MWLRLLLVCGVFIGSRSSRVLNVHEDVMSFIMGCDGRFRSLDPIPPPRVPLARTDIDPATGIETERVAMVDIPQLKKSLQESVGNDEVVTHILAHVEENLKARHDLNHGSNRCTNIKIDVPPQKVTGLSEQLQAVVQQNNYQLLEQVNTLFTFKLNSFYKDVDKLLSGQTGKLGEGLLQLQQSQQKVAENLRSSSKDHCVSAGETRIFQSDSSPNVASPIPDSPPASLEDEEVEELIPMDEPLPTENPLPIEEPQPLPVEQTLTFEEEPLLLEDSFAINDPLPIEQPLPVRKRPPVKEILPIEEEPVLDYEPHIVVENHPESDYSILRNSEPGLESPPDEALKNDLSSAGENEPEVVEEEREGEVEPRRIGFRRRRPGRPRIGRPARLGRPALRRRPGNSNTPLTVSVEKEDPIDQQPPIEPPQEDEVPEKEPRPSPKNRMELLLKRRKLLLERQQAARG